MPDDKKNGRPSSYKAEYAKQAAKLCIMGATDQELADFFEISVRTLHRWKLEFPDFAQELKLGKDVIDDRVERSLLDNALGFRYVEQQVVKVRTPDGEKTELIDVEKFSPPHVTAQIFWLKNRRQNQWRDVHKHEHGRAGDFDNMTDEQLDEWISREAAALGECHSGAEKTEVKKGTRASRRTH